MLWWDWDGRKKLILLAGILMLASTPWLVLGWLPTEWGAFVGGTAFLTVPQIMVWALFVGIRTGRIPSAYGRSELRAEQPAGFWFTAVLYFGVLVVFIWTCALFWFS